MLRQYRERSAVYDAASFGQTGYATVDVRERMRQQRGWEDVVAVAERSRQEVDAERANRELVAKMRWQICLRCGSVVSRTSGCNHMV